MVRMRVGYEYGVSHTECRIVNLHLAHLRYRVHVNDLAVIFEGERAMEYAGYFQLFSGRGLHCKAVVRESDLPTAARAHNQPCKGNQKRNQLLHIQYL